ncbi:MFS transporter [Cognatishimia sp. SS12]|uniref:MFS transporter n=1 Tax=Cognatishimia sp. SS12 TaxID=2979465 RepID=UPI00232C1FCF|nr:MFS transporter [Cognatishimia sp. SS12]MDC0737342.1 MFS transporter [Cognatishimia sp. SS12]
MVLLLMISVGLIGANSLVLSPIAAEVAAGLGLSNPADVMSAAAAYGGGVALSALLLAPLADRIGADQALKLSMIVVTAAMGLSAAAPNVGFLTVSQILAGVGVGMALPAIYTMAALMAPAGREARTIGMVLTGWTLSMVGGVTFSAYIADIFGWRMVFTLLSLGLSVVLITLYLVPLPLAPRSEKITSPISALRVSGILPALFSVGVFGVGFYGVYNYLGTHITEVMGRSIAEGGRFTLLYGLGFGASMLLDPLLDRVGPRKALSVIFLLLVPFFVACYFAAQSFVLFSSLMFVWGMINHLGLNMTVGRLSRLDPDQRGAIMGLNSATMYFSVFASTLMYRPLYDGWGIEACLIASGAVALLGAAEAFWARARRPAPQMVSS